MKKPNNNEDLQLQEVEEVKPKIEEPTQEEAPSTSEEPKEADLERIKKLEVELHNLQKRVAGQDISIEKERQEREYVEREVARLRKLDSVINFSQFDGMLNGDFQDSLNNSNRFIKQAEKKANLLKNDKLSSYMELIKNSMGIERWKVFLLTKLTEEKNDKKKKRGYRGKS